MRPIILTLAALIVLNLVTPACTPAQSATKKGSEETIASAQRDAEAAAKEAQATANEAQKQAEQAQKQAQQQAQETLKQADALSYNLSLPTSSPWPLLGLSQQTAQSILVIPLDEIKAEDLAAITEDIGIMCRVLDKKLEQDARITTRRTLLPFGGDTKTEGIYLEGYGALFVLNVNFPLIPPPETKKEEQPKEEGDTVWEETKRELRSTKEGGGFTDGSYGSGYGGGGYGGGGTMIYMMSGSDRPSEEYDLEKVEQLKTTLIKSLKHAANLHNLKPDESVIISVRGCAPGVVIQRTIAESKTDPRSTTRRSGSLSVSKRPPVLRTLPTEEGNAGSTVLTIRAKKSDIDAFSKGEISVDQFRQKVRVHTY
jgi:uncharacterized membrane protein YgcG